jgi:hypothetical protein
MNRAIGVIAAINLATTFVLPLSAVIPWLLRRITAPIPAIAEHLDHNDRRQCAVDIGDGARRHADRGSSFTIICQPCRRASWRGRLSKRCNRQDTKRSWFMVTGRPLDVANSARQTVFMNSRYLAESWSSCSKNQLVEIGQA